jgi:hypothetical protein
MLAENANLQYDDGYLVFDIRTSGGSMNERSKQQATVLDAFLTPEAMLTPGVAGAMTMMIANALAQSFELPRAYTGLALSFTIGLLVLVAAKTLIAKIVFYVLNSLVIFCVAAGASGLAPAPAAPTAEHAALTEYMTASVPNDACAAKVEAAQKAGASPAEIVKIVASCQKAGQAPPPKSRPFFAPWKF